MKTHLKKLPLLLIALLLTGCFRNDIRTVTFHVAPLDTEQSAQFLTRSLKDLPGIKDRQIDLEAQTLTLTFNGLELYLKNIESAIIRAGFDLPHWPASAADKEKLMQELN